ncbi:hypothetical protein F8M41_012767 [Gigaspora margarita]|uniref:Uncharacterized protein n=1 Tax=Gigaspora margarita TaxID=4874 RepID=A0A8H4A0T1_GIGMA|nr:hypothetical protein F8M41_012767 [Gigaspora margarita]
MFQGLSIKFKKTSKNTQSKKANKGKTANLESTRSTSLSESFSEQFDNLRVNDNTRIIENQGEILFELKVIKDKVRRIENHLNDVEQKMDNSFDITNNKAFKEDKIKGAAKALIEKVIYPENSQIKLEAKKYDRENYAEYFEKFILKDWNVYYVNNIHRPEQGNKRKNNLNYSDKVNKRPRVLDLDPEEVQEAEKDLEEVQEAEKDLEEVQEAEKDLEEVQKAEKDPDEDVDKEKDTDNEKNIDNDE